MVLPAASVRQWHLAAAAPRGAVAPVPTVPRALGQGASPSWELLQAGLLGEHLG